MTGDIIPVPEHVSEADFFLNMGKLTAAMQIIKDIDMQSIQWVIDSAVITKVVELQWTYKYGINVNFTNCTVH
jgi:hypothetical protein